LQLIYLHDKGTTGHPRAFKERGDFLEMSDYQHRVKLYPQARPFSFYEIQSNKNGFDQDSNAK
jgi:hypothetical protein